LRAGVDLKRNIGARRAGVVALWVASAVAVLAIVALGASFVSQRARVRAQEARLATLEQRVADMSTDQRLLAAIVAAGTPTATAQPAAQTTATGSLPPTTPSGTRRIFGIVRRIAKASYGWELQVDPSEYVTGTPAFSLASSLGKLTNRDGSFILDTSDRMTRLKLLKDAKVTVVSWPGEPKGASSISASELARVLPGGTSASAKWQKAWFWLDVRDGYVLQVTEQSVE